MASRTVDVIFQEPDDWPLVLEPSPKDGRPRITAFVPVDGPARHSGQVQVRLSRPVQHFGAVSHADCC
jgi:hypothetical protein